MWNNSPNTKERRITVRFVNKTAVKVIAATTPEEFETKLNKALEEIAGCKHELVFNLNAGFCAYVTYTMTQQIPETVEDEYELAGIRFYCSDCPNYVRSFDGRVKYTDCKNGHKCKAGDCACEWLYQKVKSGQISIKNDEEECTA